MSKIPPVYEQEWYNETRSRSVPSGITTCNSFYGTVTCRESMRTEFYTVPSIRTVDRNAPRRDAQIQQCTQQACVRKYGNAECKPT